MKKKILNSFCSYLEANHISFKKHDCIISLFFNDIFFGKINFQFKKGKHVKIGALCSFSIASYINEKNILDQKFIELSTTIPKFYPEINDIFDENDTPSNFKVHGSELGKFDSIFKDFGIISLYPETSENEINEIIIAIFDNYVLPMKNYYFGSNLAIEDILKNPSSYKYPLSTILLISHLHNLEINNFLNIKNPKKFPDSKNISKILDLLFTHKKNIEISDDNNGKNDQQAELD